MSNIWSEWSALQNQNYNTANDAGSSNLALNSDVLQKQLGYYAEYLGRQDATSGSCEVGEFSRYQSNILSDAINTYTIGQRTTYDREQATLAQKVYSK